MRLLSRTLPQIVLILLWASAAAAQTPHPFRNGWVLDPAASELRFLSVKKQTIAETSSFAALSGLINEEGQARISILIDSVDTNVDLRNVRMRFLFFESFRYPEATIEAQIDPAVLADLPQTRRKMIDLPYTLTLHGVTARRVDRVAVTLIDMDRVAVTSTTPIPLKLSDFNLEEGRQKLQEAANVDIVPIGTVSFDFLFDRRGAGTAVETAPPAGEAPARVALETEGNFDRTACVGRFEILSRTGNIEFASGSARLTPGSAPLLESVVDIVNRCPELDIEVSGHTDSDGSDAANLRLSSARAGAVAAYLVSKGVPPARISTVGYGESRPLVPNTGPENKRRNRRIEFSVRAD